MMKKRMIRFFATGMTALTLMGTAAAFAPARQVFAADIEVASDTSESTRELKTMSVVEADAYLKELIGDKAPYQEYDNVKMYRCGNKVYSISVYEQEPESIYAKFYSYAEAEKYYNECAARGMIDHDFYPVYYPDFDGNPHVDYLVVCGKIPKVNLSISTYTIKPVETVKITADKTVIHPGEHVSLKMDIDEGADMTTVSWRAVGAEGIADFYATGCEAYLTGNAQGQVLVLAETEDGVKDFIHIDIVDF